MGEDGAKREPGDSSPAALRTGGERTDREGALDRTEILEPARAGTEQAGRTEPIAALPTRTAPLVLRDAALAATVAMLDEASPSSPSAKAADAAPELNLRAFGPYERVEVLREQGSIGVVARGYNGSIGRWELLKFLRSEFQGVPEVVRQFRAEGKILALLSHPNVVQVFAAYELDGHTCLALEFLEGESLEAQAAREPLTAARGSELLLDAARGLAAAHEIGLLHRDLKPENLFIARSERGRSGGLKLIDFGLATLDRALRHRITHDPALDSGAVGGTPLFMAPELWLGQDSSPQSDLYALGLSFYFALSGRYPFDDLAELSLDGVRRKVLDPEPFVSLKRHAPELPAGLVAVVDRLIDKDPKRRPRGADELVAELVGLGQQTSRGVIPPAGPYRGLTPFTSDERGVFFGRERETIEICERLRLSAGCVLVGPSGSGKSSLARAGVLPAIEQGALGGGLVFTSAVLSPGRSPASALAEALASALGARGDVVLELLASSPERLASAVSDALPKGRGLVLLVDQLEELTTYEVTAAERLAFAEALRSLTRTLHPAIRLLVTLRADVMDGLFALEPLSHLLSQGFHPVRPLSREGLRAAIEAPARAAGYAIEQPELVQEILKESEEIPLSLPLLSFALSEWWRARDTERQLLQTHAWRELGGITGALVTHAEHVIDGLGPEERRAAMQLLVRLVTSERTRARVLRQELLEDQLGKPGAERVLSQLLSSKLLTEVDGAVELAHDALITRWRRLSRWLDEAGEDQAFRQRVFEAARQWDADGRSHGSLWDDELAQRLLSWFSTTEAELGQRELAFIEAVRRRSRNSRVIRRGAIVAAFATLLALLVVSSARESSLDGRVAGLEAQAQKSKADTERRLGRLYAELASRRLSHDPPGAVRAARRARDHGERAELDLLGWRASRIGIPRALPWNPSGIKSVVFDSRSARLAALWRDGTLRVLELGGGGDRAVELSGAGAATLLGFTQDGKQLIWARTDSPARIGKVDWRGGEGSSDLASCPGQLDGFVAAPRGFGAPGLRAPGFIDPGFVPVGGWAVKCAEPAELVHWVSDGGVSAFVPSPASAYAAGSGYLARIHGTELSVWDLESSKSHGSVKLTLPLGSPAPRLALLPQGVVIADSTGALWFVPIRGGRARPAALSGPQAGPALGTPTLLKSPHREAVLDLEATASGLVSRDPSKLVLWQATGDALEPVRDEPEARGRVLGLPGRHQLAWPTSDGNVDVWSAEGQRLAGRLPLLGEQAEELIASPDGRWLVVLTRAGRALIYDLDRASGRELTPGGSSHCRVAADGLSVGCLEQDLVLYDQTGAEQVVPLAESAKPAPGAVKWALGPDGAAAWVTSSGALAVRSKGALRLLELPPPQALAISRRGDKVAIVTERGGAAALQLIEGDTTIQIPGDVAGVNLLAFSPDGTRLAAASRDGAIRSFDLAVDHAPDQVARVLVGAPKSLVFSSDQRELLVVGAHGSALVNATERRAEPLVNMPSGVSCAAFSQSGRALVLGTQAGEVWLYDRDSTESARVTPGGAAHASAPSPITQCVRVASEDRFVFSQAHGNAWSETYDLRAIWLLPRPDDLERGAPEPWQGLAGDHGH